MVVAILALLWTTLVMNLLHEQRRIVRGVERDTSNLAGAAEQVFARTIEAVDQRIHFVRAAFRADRVGYSLDFLGQEAGFLDGAALQTTIIGPTGQLWMSSLGPVSNRVDLSDRAHVRYHFDHPEDELYISIPVLERESGRWLIHFTRKLWAPDGAFAGVVVASVAPHGLTRLYASFDLGHAVLTLIGRDGVVRARAPRLDAALGRDITGAAALDMLLSRDQNTTRQVSPLDGIERIVSHRRIAGYPLVVLVGCDVADIAAEYATYRDRALLSGAGLTVLVLAAGALLFGYRWRQLGSQRALSAAIENITQGLVMVDRRGRVLVHNRHFIELLGLPAGLMASRPNFGEIVRWQRESGEFGPGGVGKAEALLGMPRGVVSGAAPPGSGLLPQNAPAYERVRPDGTVLEIRTQLLPDGGVVRTYADVTERRMAEERIRFLAYHDALTGLANRFLLREQLEEALEAAREAGRTLAVLAVDLDGFTAVNDTLGHTAGDLLLIQVAGRLRAAVRAGDATRDGDVVARLGGDEFVILQAGALHPDAAEALGRRLIARLSEPVLLQGQEAGVGISVGISLYPRDGTRSDDLLRRANIALYHARTGGRGMLRFFERQMEERSRERRTLEQDLRCAMESGGLVLRYQPVFSCGSNQITGVEALLRWTHPTRGEIPPVDFVTVAEESGLIQQLGRWVLGRACADAASWPGEVRVAVNLSPAQFRGGDLPSLVADTLARAGLSAGRLELEVTEGLLIRDTDQALAIMTALKQLGVTFALDDFGTGYSSMGYLRRFPFDRIKIDRSFVCTVGSDGQAGAIAEAIMALAKALNIKATAEGVETQEQLDFLCHHGCDEVQGFLLARPLATEQIAALLMGSYSNPPAGRHESEAAVWNAAEPTAQ